MRDIATAIVHNTILTVRRTDYAGYVLHIEYPEHEGVARVDEVYADDVRDVFTKMGTEVRLLLHAEQHKAIEEAMAEGEDAVNQAFEESIEKGVFPDDCG